MASRVPEFSAAVPALTAERPVTWPKRTRARLANGLEVVLAEAHSIPKFHGELYFRAGNALVSDRSTGLAEMTATLVRTGTSKRASPRSKKTSAVSAPISAAVLGRTPAPSASPASANSSSRFCNW